MTPTSDTIEKYQSLSIASVASNEPYGVGTAGSEQAAIRKHARDDFLETTDTPWPEINYPLLHADEFRSAEHNLLTLLGEVTADSEMDDGVKNVAYEQIAIKLAEVYRHLEIVRGLGSVGVKHELSRQQAGDMTLEIFGEPDKEIFDGMLATNQHIAEQLLGSSDKKLARVAQEFLELTGNVQASQQDKEVTFELTGEAIKHLRVDFEVLFPGVHAFFDHAVEEKISPKEAVPYFSQALGIVGLTEKGWVAEESDGSAVEVDGASKKMLIGRNRGSFTSKTIKTVPWHEAIHALRNQNASEQKEPVKRRALPGNLLVEEGIATTSEQIMSGERRVAGVAYYMSLGLQMGMDNHGEGKRDFRQTHEIMWRRSLLEKNSQSPNSSVTEKDILKAKETAYQTVIRTTRGNSLDARDISYFVGGNKATKWCNEVAQLPKEERLKKLKWMLSGLFDPTHPEHVELFDGESQTD